MKRYFKLLVALCFCSLMVGACKDLDNETEGNSGDIIASFGTPLLKTTENISPLQIPVVLSRPASHDVEVRVAVSKEDGAVEGTHYKFHSKEVTIAKGASAGYIEVDLMDDREINADRIFEVDLLEATGIKVSETNGVCKVVIRSDEGLPLLELGKNVISVGEDEGLLEIPVILSRRYTQDVSLKVYVIDSTARQGEHFTILNPEIMIAAGDTSVNIQVRLVNDNEINQDRIFLLRIADGKNAVVSEVYADCRVTIVNDDRASYISFTETKGEVFESGESFIIPVKIEGHPKTPVTVSFRMLGGTATEGTDFEFESSTLTFPVGVKEKGLKVIIRNNDDVNKDRKIQIGFAALDGVEKAEKDTLYTLTVLNDDFDYKKLYDEMMGTWTLKQTGTVNCVPTCSVTISGGSTLEEQDANYLKFFVCRATKYAQGSTDVVWRMSYNADNGEMAVVCGEEVAWNIGFGGNYGQCNIRFERPGDKYGPVSMTHNKNFTEFIWEPGTTISGILYSVATGERFNTHWFTMENVVLTKNK